MRIRRFSAADMRQAIRRVHDEMAEDVAHVGSRREWLLQAAAERIQSGRYKVIEGYMARYFARESLHECV